ncbi:MAG: class I SAM-dependent methyltransferase [Chthoniobacterales bacterium]
MKLSLSDYVELLRYAPPGRRFELARKLRQLPSREQPGEMARYLDIGEFKNWEHFETKYRELAVELGQPGKVPAPGEVDFLHAMVDLDDVRYPGGIGSRDYFFLTCMVSILAPHRVIEIGTLTGFSTAIIAAAIHRQHGTQSGITVDTVDSHTHCSIDTSRPIGFEIAELVPNLASNIRIHTGRESDLVSELASRGEFDLAFIDADHRHPWPLLDVLRLAPSIKPQGWIVLHDIQLGSYGASELEAGRGLEGRTPYGAEWLFDRWPFRKIRSFHIGAVELPAEREVLVPFAFELMQQPFELRGKAAKRIRRELYQSLIALV